jgi:branched-chain amino acid transport system substrate-binding protein
LIVGDVGLQGRDGRLGAQTSEAIQLVLEQHRYRAGRYAIGYQSCDDSTATGFTPAKCKADARAYAENPRVIGEIGAPGSECSEAELPIANAAPGGPLAMVAADNTYVGLTHRGPGTAAGEPAKYYPTGIRNYVRVIAADDVQGAADALLARRRGARRVFVLDDEEAYGNGIAADFARAARRLGMTVIGPTAWNYAAKSYDPVVAQIVHSQADAVFLGTFNSPETFRLIKDLRAALPTAVLVAPDGFAPPADLIAGAGAAAEGMTVSVVGRPPESLPPHGRKFVNDFKRATGNTTPVASSIAAAQATEVLLTAIASSNGTRASVAKQLFRTHIANGILGSFSFDHNGDTTEGAVTIYRIRNGAPSVYAVITPPAALTR